MNKAEKGGLGLIIVSLFGPAAAQEAELAPIHTHTQDLGAPACTFIAMINQYQVRIYKNNNNTFIRFNLFILYLVFKYNL